MVFIAQEEYSSGEEIDEEEETTTTPATSLVAMAKTPTPSSLFDSPNEKAPIPNASCFMEKSLEVSSSKPSNDNSSNMHDDSDARTNSEIIAFNKCLNNLEGDNRKYF